jgi:hypothetical protein
MSLTTFDLQNQGWEKQPDGSYKRLPHAKADLLLTDQNDKPTALVYFKPKRMRQRTKPLLNKLESAFLNLLFHRCQFTKIHCQAIRFQLANGMAYTPDLFAFDWPDHDESSGNPVTWPHAWEIKGPHAWDDSIAKLKMAAKLYPEITWILAWKDKVTGQWQEQRVLP